VPDPRTLAIAALRFAVAIGAVAGVGALAHLPLGEEPREGALRIALRTPLGQIEVCRDRTAAELEALPQHMRQPRVCDVHTVDYRLLVAVDGRTRIDRIVRHRGVRRNRPLVVDEMLRLPPGLHAIDVRFEPAEAAAAVPAELPRAALHDDVDFASGRIRLLTLDPDAATWTVHG